MKIVMISDLAIGGGSRHTIALSEELRRRGNDVDIISFEEGATRLPHFKITSHYKVLSSKKRLFELLKEKEPDLIHMHHPVGSVDFLVKEIKEKMKKPVVNTIHLSPADGNLVDAIVTIYLRNVSKGLRYSDKIICVSNFVKNNFERISDIPEKKFVVIPNGVDVSKFRHQAKKSKDFKILFVGRLSPEKGLSLLFKSFDMLKCGKLYIIGDGPLKASCIRKAQKNKNVVFLGRVSDKVLVDNYSSASLVAVPSLWQEAFGMVLIEAMSCETPPITFGVGGMSEIIRDEYNGFLARQNSPEAFYHRLLEARENDLEKIGKNGRKDVLKKYSWEIVAKETLKVYKSLT
jgi:glycosyltransferase involved in cell wall biosynthesis